MSMRLLAVVWPRTTGEGEAAERGWGMSMVWLLKTAVVVVESYSSVKV